jgi:hypothetical protein
VRGRCRVKNRRARPIFHLTCPAWHDPCGSSRPPLTRSGSRRGIFLASGAYRGTTIAGHTAQHCRSASCRRAGGDGAGGAGQGAGWPAAALAGRPDRPACGGPRRRRGAGQAPGGRRGRSGHQRRAGATSERAGRRAADEERRFARPIGAAAGRGGGHAGGLRRRAGPAAEPADQGGPAACRAGDAHGRAGHSHGSGQ